MIAEKISEIPMFGCDAKTTKITIN